MKKNDTGNTSTSDISRESLYKLLGFYYPIHYQIGLELERRTCQNRLSRQQTAVLWMIESEVGAHGWMRRKRIGETLSSWFDTRNSHVTQLLRELSESPLSMIVQKNNPESGREKIVALTDVGREYFEQILAAGIDYFTELLPHMTEKELNEGMTFLAKAFGAPTL